MNDSSRSIMASVLDAASDEDLACRVQDGCTDSFTELANRLQPRLMFVLRRRLGHHADAEDITQKTLLRAFEKIDRYDPTKKFSPWLFTIALRLATDHHRQQKTHDQPTGETASAVEDPQPNPEQHAIASEQSADLWTLAQEVLKPNQWTALWLLYGEGQTVREIAQALDTSTVSIRVMLYRARKKLAPHLSDFLDENSTTAEMPPDATLHPTLQVARVES